MNRSCHTYQWICSILGSWAPTNESCLMYEYIMIRHFEFVGTQHSHATQMDESSDIEMSHVTHINESAAFWVRGYLKEPRHTYQWVMTHVWMRHNSFLHEWVMSHIHMNESCRTFTCMSHVTHTHEWVMSHIHMNESCHVYTWMSHVTSQVRGHLFLHLWDMTHLHIRDTTSVPRHVTYSYVTWYPSYGGLFYRALLQNIVSFIGLFCKRDL